MPLITRSNLESPDASYAALIAAHEGLPEPDSHAMNARLILILMNHIGDAATLAEALTLARDPAPKHDRDGAQAVRQTASSVKSPPA